MGFDFGCLLKVFQIFRKCRSSGEIDFVSIGLQLAKLAIPYIVQYLGEVERPPRVDVDDVFQQAAQAEGIKPWRAPSKTKGTVRGLFIGINYYGTGAELSGCCNNVKQMLATLQKKRFHFDDMCILVDEQGFPGAKGLPTRANMLQYFAWLVRDAKPGDVLFLHYSGHSTKTRAAKDSHEEFDQCIAPVDYDTNGCILDDDLYKVLLEQLPQGVRLTAVFDCCHSSSLLDLPFSFVANGSVRSTIKGHMQRIRSGNNTAADVLMISSSADEQTSADVLNTEEYGTGGSGAGGAATQCLTHTMLKTSHLTFQEMLILTRDMLKKKKFSQVPQLSASKPLDLQQEFSLIDAFKIDAEVT